MEAARREAKKRWAMVMTTAMGKQIPSLAPAAAGSSEEATEAAKGQVKKR